MFRTFLLYKVRKRCEKQKSKIQNHKGIMSNKNQMIFDLLDMIEHADNLETLRQEAKRIRRQIEAEFIFDAMEKTNKSYDELMNFLKGEYDE